ncbi:MAG: UDP-glucose--hexose-1-phosphate uridylyltransferase [bacterium]
MKNSELNNFPHRRKNILTGDWILVSPHRTKRPWQGDVSKPDENVRPAYDPECYLCPGNKRANGEFNPDYKSTFVFTNDFSSLLDNIPTSNYNRNDLLVAKSEIGISRVVNFSPRHDLTLAEMDVDDIHNVISVWQDEYKTLGSHPKINHVQIFENKGLMMGNSNPHPHCQIWSQQSIPTEVQKELKKFKNYYSKNKRSLLADYLKLELKLNERIVFENSSFVVLVPYWATWPYETLVAPKRKIVSILHLKENEKREFAVALKVVTTKYDNLFQTSFPYSFGIHQSPTDGRDYKEYHFHAHYHPPLLRSASIRKFMVGYELLAEPQRDITPEYSAGVLKELPITHYKQRKK